MKEAKKAAFRFVNYSIPEFSFNEPSTPEADSLRLKFDAAGKYDLNTGLFTINVIFIAMSDVDDQEVIKSRNIATFEFSEKNISVEELPPYFYRNALAIFFPYLRSFISNITLQANLKLLILPILNLSDMEAELRQNTTVVS